MEQMLEIWKDRLKAERVRLEREPFTACREVIRQNIENYTNWIAQAEDYLNDAPETSPERTEAA